MVIDEFLVRLGVITDPKDLADFRSGLQSVGSVATAVVGTIGALAGGVTAFFGAALEGLDSLNDLAQDTATDLGFIQQLGYAAQLSGSSVEAANASVQGLARTIGEAASGIGRGAESFKKYSLSAKNADGSVKGVAQVLEDVRAKMVGLSRAEQLSLLSKLGIDPSMVGLLSSTNAEMLTLFEEAQALGLVTADGADAAGEFNDSVDQMNMVMGALRTNIAVGLAPSLTALVGRFRDWIVRNRDLIQNGLSKTVEWILAIFNAVLNFIRAIDQIIDATIGWRAALILLAAGLALVKRASIAAFVTNPVFLIAAAIAGLIVLVDDLITYLKGGKSAFDWSFATGLLKDISGHLENLTRAVGVFWDRWGSTIMGGLASLWSAFKGFLAWLVNAVAAAFALLTGDWEGFTKYGQAAMAGLLQYVTGIWEAIYAVAKVVFGALGIDLDGVAAAFSAAWDGLAAGFSAAINTVTDLWDGAMGVIMTGVDKVRGALNWIGKKLGLSSDSVVTVAQEAGNAADSAQRTAAGASAAAAAAAGAPLGGQPAQAGGTVNMQNQFHITTNDPKAAATLAADAVARQQAQAARNVDGPYKL